MGNGEVIGSTTADLDTKIDFIVSNSGLELIVELLRGMISIPSTILYSSASNLAEFASTTKHCRLNGESSHDGKVFSALVKSLVHDQFMINIPPSVT
jgi:hypothetical protein